MFVKMLKTYYIFPMKDAYQFRVSLYFVNILLESSYTQYFHGGRGTERTTALGLLRRHHTHW